MKHSITQHNTVQHNTIQQNKIFHNKYFTQNTTPLQLTKSPILICGTVQQRFKVNE